MHAAILRYFSVVARSGSIRKASEELHVATSALSRQIQKLEDELGTPLFERLPKGLRLTRAGEAVLEHADRTLQDFEVLRGELGALRGVKSGQVRIACLDSLLVNFLPNQIRAFNRAHPGVDYRVQSGAHSRITAMVADGDADFGITFNVSHPDDTQLIHDIAMPLKAMVAKDHPLARLPAVTLSECAQYNLLLQLDTEPIRSLIEVELSVLHRSGRNFVTSNHIMLLRQMIRFGLGVAFYTPIGLVEELDAGEIVGVPLKGTRLGSLRLGLLVPKRRQMTHAASAMVEQLGGALAELEAAVG
jgi:DNA-binding transcriptional LysR family regulator